MRIVNIVDRLDRVNFGIWNAAISTAAELKRQFDVDSEIWFPAATNEANVEELNGAIPRSLPGQDMAEMEKIIIEARLDSKNDVIVTHGCWRYPTRWGRALKKRGFKWMAVPHGMLEPWSMSQKRWLKWGYFHLIEKPALLDADKIRAVGKPEYENLIGIFGDQLVWIPNGVPWKMGEDNPEKSRSPVIFLFMARLHHKKGILPLLQAWLSSSLAYSNKYLLKIAGPDDGELDALTKLLADNPKTENVELLGPVYGGAKEKLLQEAHFYVLPSFSEGFPTSVLEAMQNGLIPIISEGCNIPDVSEHKLGIIVEPNRNSLITGLNQALAIDQNILNILSKEVRKYIEDNYSVSIISGKVNECIIKLYNH